MNCLTHMEINESNVIHMLNRPLFIHVLLVQVLQSHRVDLSQIRPRIAQRNRPANRISRVWGFWGTLAR